MPSSLIVSHVPHADTANHTTVSWPTLHLRTRRPRRQILKSTPPRGRSCDASVLIGDVALTGTINYIYISTLRITLTTVIERRYVSSLRFATRHTPAKKWEENFFICLPAFVNLLWVNCANGQKTLLQL